jgi:hypothetical protein
MDRQKYEMLAIQTTFCLFMFLPLKIIGASL